MSRRVTISNEVVRLMCDLCHFSGRKDGDIVYLTTKNAEFKMILKDNIVMKFFKENENGEMQEQELVTDNFFDVMKVLYRAEQF